MGVFIGNDDHIDLHKGLRIGKAISPLVEGIHTGNIKTVTSQSKAGLGTQGAIQTHSYPEALPAPKDMEIPD